MLLIYGSASQNFSFITQNRLSESPFLPNVDKTLTAQKNVFDNWREIGKKNRKQTICLMQCLYFKHL
jgi:hypothetical protein